MNFNIKIEIKCVILLIYYTQYYLLINPMVLINYWFKWVNFTVKVSSYSLQTDAMRLWGQLNFQANYNLLLTHVRNGCFHYLNCNCIVVVGVTASYFNTGVYLSKMYVNWTKMKLLDSNMHNITIWGKQWEYTFSLPATMIKFSRLLY